MRHIIATPPKGDIDAALEAGYVHYEGAGIIGSHTLCALTDLTCIGWKFEETTKRVNCPGCVGVRNHVLGR